MEGTQTNTHTPNQQENIPPVEAVPSLAEVTPPEQGAPPVDLKDADDKTKIETYNKMFGTNYTSLDEIKPKAAQPTKEEIEAAKAQKRQDSLAWAVTNGKLKQEDIEKAVLAKSKETRDIAFEIHAKNLREEDPDMSEDDIRSSFEDEYHEDKDEKSPLRRAALKRMEKLAEAYRAENAGAYDSVEEEYEAAMSSKAQYETYSTGIKSVAKDLPKSVTVEVPFKSLDGSEVPYKYEVPVDEKIVDKIRKDFLSENTFKFLGADVKPEEIREEMLTAIRGKMLPQIIAEVVRQDRENVQKEIRAQLKNIPSTGPGSFVRTPAVGTPKQPIKHTALEAADARRYN